MTKKEVAVELGRLRLGELQPRYIAHDLRMCKSYDSLAIHIRQPVNSSKSVLHCRGGTIRGFTSLLGLWDRGSRSPLSPPEIGGDFRAPLCLIPRQMEYFGVFPKT